MSGLLAAVRGASAGPPQPPAPESSHSPAPKTTPPSSTTVQSPQSPQHQQPASRPQRHPTPPAADRAERLLQLLRLAPNGEARGTAQPAGPSTSGEGSGHLGLTGTMASSTGGNHSIQNIHGRGVSASDLVASSMGKPAAVGSAARSSASSAAASSPGPSGNPQDYLLQLLNRSHMASSPPTAMPFPPLAGGMEHRWRQSAPVGETPARTENTAESSVVENAKEPSWESPRPRSAQVDPHGALQTSLQQTVPSFQLEAAKNPIFTYVNPFEQLAASSPRNAASRSETATPQKHTPPLSRLNSDVGTVGGGSQEHLKAGHDTKTHAKTILPADSKVTSSTAEPLVGISAPTTDPSTVAQALTEVSEQVSRQADFALAQAEEQSAMLKKTHTALLHNPAGQDSTGIVETPSIEMNPNNRPQRQSTSLPAVDNSAKETDHPEESQADGHGSVDDEISSANGEEGLIVPVYNFVMKPFVSIHLFQTKPPGLHFREDAITEIARLKKEFDQIDRTLATASAEYIIYSLPKSGGIRVIRQEDGVDRQLFKETKDHVFNVSISSAVRGKSAYDLQTAIATATSGTVYWTALHHNRDNIEAPNIKDHCLIFPPVSPNDDHGAGGQLKTRAKRTSRHPELFAIGRGKLIQIVFPLHALRSGLVDQNHVVDTASYFKQRSLKINTGKAGKDFTFSEDDTVVATLDKAGRLRFWDIRELIHESNREDAPLSPIEIRTPILTLSTATPPEKCWPTSVLFVDKMRAYTKGTALRYVIVGMKQNHTLQLWDLGFGKAIQEVHFPHSKESDAICSVCYHPASGIIVVGHPTRNSIYFIHLSAPKYSLPGMSQARYLARLADKDAALPKIEATAIMSGMREYSFASKGQLRSVDLLSLSTETLMSKEQSGLFELYVMHSKGVTMLSIHREDLGWSDDMKVLHPVNAIDEGIISIKELVQPPTAIVSENSSVNGDIVPPTTIVKKHNVAPTRMGDKATTDDTDHAESKDRGASGAGVGLGAGAGAEPGAGAGVAVEKSEKRKKKKGAIKEAEATVIPSPAPAPPQIFGAAIPKGLHPAQTSTHNKDLRIPRKPTTLSVDDKPSQIDTKAGTLDISIDFMTKELERFETSVSGQFKEALERELAVLYKRINEDIQVRDAQNGADREALLRLISKHLGSNLEAALTKIVSESMEHRVIPSFQEVVASVLQRELSNNVGQTLHASLSKELGNIIPRHLSKQLQSQEFTNSISAGVAQKAIDGIQKSLEHAEGMSSESSQHIREMLHEMEVRIDHNFGEILLKRDENDAKIDHLMELVTSLNSTVQSMAAAQAQLRAELVNIRESPAAEKTGYVDPVPEAPITSQIDGSHQESEELQSQLRSIMQMMSIGQAEDATVKWLQSRYQAEIFDRLFVRLDPRYLHQCSPLVTLSVAAAVTASLENHVTQKIDWLDIILSSIKYDDPDIKDVAPKIMDVLCQRLESRYQQLADQEPHGSLQQRIPSLIRKARDLGKASSRS